MDETKNTSETEASQTPAGNPDGSSDETKSLPGAAGSQPPVDSRSDISEVDPSKIGRYRVIRRLGQGGFGRVYLAHDDDLDRPVAIKVPNPERITRSEDAEAFLIEARILAKLDHPHIVPVHDVGRTEDGLCFVVSKLVEGSDLAVRMGQARMAFRDSAELVANVADALHYAHTRGLVHRDIKPANILIDASAKPCVADFGLALKDEDFGKGGGLAGTPSYMSPEQARGEGHLVDGRSDIFSLGVVLYELLTGRRPFRGDSLPDVIEQVTQAEARPPRQVDDTIPRVLERICLKALAKRASERYTTARDMAEDLRFFLQGAGGTASPVAPVAPLAPPGSTLEATPLPATSQQSDSDQRPVRIVPKGLRSFDEQDAEFFLELLPGPRDRDGLPESIRFWKRRIEQLDADKTFRVGLIYGPSGCGKSSLIKAGLLPRLGQHVLSVYVEATAEETEARLLKGVRKVCPELPRGRGLVNSLAQLRRGRILPPERKVLLVVDQFEQWLFARRAAENTELIAALRHCDGEHVQAVVLVRDDFWLAASRFMRDLEIRLVEGENSTLVDLFDPRHAKKVLTAFGRAYGALPDKIGDLNREQESFVDQSISGLAQDGKIISVRLALFAEMTKGKPWTSATLREVGGTEGVGLTFVEETFGAPTAPREHRFHQKAAQAVLKTLLPESSMDIKGQMRSRQELLEASGYANRSRDFDDLLRILDLELRLITPTEAEDSSSEGEQSTPSGQYYVLAHDYLVHSLRDWLTRKQRDSRRGRAELRLAERSASWNAKPENRHLPSALEWASIRLLTQMKDWNEPQREMMKRAGRVHGARGVLTVALLAAGVLGGIALRRHVIENQRATQAAGLVQLALDADTPRVPEIVGAMRDYRRWVDPLLRTELEKGSNDPRQKLHASLALLPVDATQVDYLFNRLLRATPTEFPALRDALKRHRSTLTPKLWTALESAKPGDASLLPTAGALASYDPDNTKWEALGSKVAQTLVTINSIYLGLWLEALRPVRGRLTAPMVSIFRDERPESEHAQATNILTDYARDDPDRLAELLMVSDSKAYLSLFPVAEKKAEQVLPMFQAELARKATYSWNDPPLNRSWTKPDPALVSRIESAQGILSERFAFCQTLPLDEFLTTVEALRKSGYRPVRFRPYSDQQVVRVAGVWTRDGRNWRISSGLSPDEVRQQDERNKKDKFLPVDVAGYVTTDTGGKPIDRYAAIWAEKSGDDDARLYVGTTPVEEAWDLAQFTDAKLIPRTLHALIASDGRARYSGVWGRPRRAAITGRLSRLKCEASFEQLRADLSDGLIIDVAVSGASKSESIRDVATTALQIADETLKTKPGDLDARLDRAVANLRLEACQKVVDDLQFVIEKQAYFSYARQCKIFALARLGKRQDAESELASFQNDIGPERSKLSVAAILEAELGKGADTAAEALDAATQKYPHDAYLRDDAAGAFALASKAVSRSDEAKGRRFRERSLQLLRVAVEKGDAEFGDLEENFNFDPIRDDPAFIEIMKAGHPGRRYSSAWTTDESFEAASIYAVDPATHMGKCKELIAQGYRPVSWSVARSNPAGALLTASVWHRPVVSDEVKDRLAARQARAAIALVRQGQDRDVWQLLRHSADPRLRSFIINLLEPLGADPRLIAAELARLGSSPRPPERGEPGRSVGDGAGAPDTGLDAESGAGRLGNRANDPPTSGTMDAILFHPETSQRRALILSLGTYAAGVLSPGEREPLVGKLLDLYRNDPDAGIHGAVQWTLLRWGQRDKLMAVDADLMKARNRGDRRWFVNSRGQTFVVVEGPVAYRMGSMPTDTERHIGERVPRRMVIPRRFAIASQEVSVEQFEQFRRENPPVPRDHVHSPDPDCPQTSVSWCAAVAYCNWLSRHEGLPECYVPNTQGQYRPGMKIKADFLFLGGYRLPTEAEWEYACRAGAETRRYYGATLDLLGQYAWHSGNAQERSHPCGSLLPNDLGLFDMLGNVFESCQEDDQYCPSIRRSMCVDLLPLEMYEPVRVTNVRVLRGGAFPMRPDQARSSARNSFAPESSYYGDGFRPVRTLQ